MIPTRMIWGKHRGKRFTDIDEAYLFWLANTADIDRNLRRAVEEELERREAIHAREEGSNYSASGRRGAHYVTLAAAQAIITEGKRAIAAKAHPDKEGGNALFMAATNSTADYLLAELPRFLAGVAR